MIDFIIPKCIFNSNLFTLLWILLNVGNFVLYNFTFHYLSPHCERLILPPSSGDFVHPRPDARLRSKICASISAIVVSDIITHSFGLVGGVLFSVSAAQYTSSTWLATFHTCVATVIGMSWMAITFFSVRHFLRMVQMAKKRFAAEARVMEGLGLALVEKEQEKGQTVVRCVDCASRLRRSSV